MILEDLRYLTFSFANVITQLTEGEPLSPKYLIQGAPAAFPFGLCNVARSIGHLMAQRMHPSPMNDEFVGMTEYIVESFHDLLAGDSESPPTLTLVGGDIIPRENILWQVPLRDMSKVSMRNRLPQ